MVRPINVARSRACVQCKKKRIKCDLTSPACQRCVLSNLPCSGPLSGLFMVNVDPSTFAPMVCEKIPTAPSALAPLALTPGSATPGVMYRTPSPGPVYEDALLWSFLGAFFHKSASRIWEAKLPYLESAGNPAAVKAAAKAVSLAFAANSLNDLAVAVSACESYGRSLRYHQRSFIADQEQEISHKKAVHALPVTILLSFFETIQPTSADAWIRHIAAAERLFLLIGPHALQDDLLNHLYLIVKSSSVTRCFLTGSRTQLFGQPWSNVHANHVRGCPSLLFNRIMEFMACLSDQFATVDPPENRLSIFEKLTELSELFVLFEDSLGPGTSGFSWMNPNLGSEAIQVPPLLSSEYDIPDVPVLFRDPSAYLTAACLHTAALLLFTLLRPADCKERSQNDIDISRAYHSTRILSCAKHLATSGGSSCPRMAFPIAAVHRHSPNQQHKILARTIFTRWCNSTGLSGFCTAVFGQEPIVKAKTPFIVPGRETVPQESNLKFNEVVRDRLRHQLSPDHRWPVRKCDVCGA